MRSRLHWIPALLALFAPALSGAAEIRIHPEREKQVIWGLGFEIQSDSIGSGNQGLPENRVAVPHDLTPSERQRFYREMLKGFRYCRLAGGLYWRGLDSEGKFLRPRWPEQLAELREMLQVAGVEGLSFEYWSPAPYWKANRSYIGLGREDPYNTLRCFGPEFVTDPEYKGDVDRFLTDFAAAVVTDIKTLRAAGIPTVQWGLQNEPWVSNAHYPACRYPDSPTYVRAYRAVASAIRRYDARILLFADTESAFPRKIGPAMNDPEIAGLVDAYVVHTIGAPSENVREVHAKIRAELPFRPWFQNEYEYLTGGATRERCLNTVQHIMNSFQLAENPTWYWIHALKPFKNAEASGYSLGFWKSLEEPAHTTVDERRRRWREGPVLTQLPAHLERFEMVVPTRGDAKKTGVPYDFSVNQPVTVHLLVEDVPGYEPGRNWERTDEIVSREGGHDRVYRRTFAAGRIDIPEHSGKTGDTFAAPHLAFLEPGDAATLKAQIGINVPIQIRSEALELERAAARMQPGHWIYNPYNWNAVGSFVKRMPWDSLAIDVTEADYDPDARVHRGLAVGLYSVGGAVGATIAPVLVLFLADRYGWRGAFVVTGALGLVFVAVWLTVFRRPEEHPWLTDSERALICSEARTDSGATAAPLTERARWISILTTPAVWALMFARLLTDPVWYFFQFWMPKYLYSARGFEQHELAHMWLIYLAADVGFIGSGLVSGYLIHRGRGARDARLRTMFVCALLVPLAPLIALSASSVGVFSVSMIVVLAHTAWLASISTYVVDLVPKPILGTAFGFIAAGSAVGGILMNNAVAWTIARFSYDYCFYAMIALHPLAFVLLWRFARQPWGGVRH